MKFPAYLNASDSPRATGNWGLAEWCGASVSSSGTSATNTREGGDYSKLEFPHVEMVRRGGALGIRVQVFPVLGSRSN